MAVITALEFYDHVPVGKTARQPDGAHGGFGAGIDHAHLLQRRHHLTQRVGHARLDLGGRTESQAVGGGFADGVHDIRVTVPANHGAPGAHIIHVAFAVCIEQVRPRATAEKDRAATDPRKGAYR